MLVSIAFPGKEKKQCFIYLFVCLLGLLPTHTHTLLRVEFMVSHMLGKGSPTGLHLQPKKTANCLELVILPCAQTD